TSSPHCIFQISFDKSELALRLERQGLSVKLVPLPDLWRTRHGNHEIDRLFPVSLGFIQIASQCMDASTQCGAETGRADALARVTPFKIAPFLFQCDDFIPAVKAKSTLALKPTRGGLLPNGLRFDGQCFR